MTVCTKILSIATLAVMASCTPKAEGTGQAMGGVIDSIGSAFRHRMDKAMHIAKPESDSTDTRLVPYYKIAEWWKANSYKAVDCGGCCISAFSKQKK